ncbi:unnamed protein product [Blepharisma stoltei]|uniref:Homeobox domain-containing protein n=1 Tax=Blepharisma stoltei TaxID=1481888 RepID=A0AAU9KBQ2_9CILI|nr:unnamed protein product [Blepharisma stoltei]
MDCTLRDQRRTLLQTTNEHFAVAAFDVSKEESFTTSPFPSLHKEKQVCAPSSPVPNDFSTISSPSETQTYPLKKRQRKNGNQLEVLKREFNPRQMWDKDKIEEIALITGLSLGQIYKWNWDKFQKSRIKKKCFPDPELVCLESLSPTALEVDFLKVQRSYKLSLATLAVQRSLVGNNWTG